MNKLTRLTALLLAMLMIFSTVATAETGYQVGSMTTEQWQSIVDSAEEQLNREIESGEAYPLPTPPVVDSQPYAETHEVELSEGSFTMSKADLAIVESEQSGRWQIAVGETVNDQNETVYLWANLAGETGTSLNVNYTMLQNFPHYVIRQVNYDADNQLVQVGMLTFTLTEPTTAMTLNAVARDGETTPENGDATSEPTSKPLSFERANNLVNITVTYKFADVDTTMPVSLRGTTAADPDGIENCRIGNPLTNSVPNKPIAGYEVSYAEVGGERIELNTPTDGITVTQANVALNDYTVPAEDVEIVVYYTSAVVAYTVKSWFEPLNGGSHAQDLDNYPNKTISNNSAALTGHTLTITPDTVSGYQVLYFDEPILAANGSTSVNVYYNRSWYLMNFNLDGGYGVDPIYAKFGATIEVPVDDKAPTKPGYVFLGWDGNGDGVADTMPTTMPAGNTTYKALWKMEPVTTVTIVYWGENADDEEYAYLSSEVATVESGKSFTYTTGSVCPLDDDHVHSANCNLVYEHEAHTHGAGCYELVCTLTPHTHSTACYSNCTHEHDRECASSNSGSVDTSAETDNQWINAINQGSTNSTSGLVTATRRVGMSTQTRYYIKIGDSYYRVRNLNSNNDRNNFRLTFDSCEHVHGASCVSCPETVHTHTDYLGACYKQICTKAIHIHSEACYDCGEVEHTHDETCTVTGPGLSTDLWKYVESDTETVNPDGSTVVNVYYDRVEKTLTFNYDYNRNYNSNNGYRSTETITAKWGADISDEYIAIVENADGSTFWTKNSGGSGPYTNYFGIMPQSNATYYNQGATGSNGTMTYYGQNLAGNGYDIIFTVSGVGGYTVTNEDRYEFEGFTYQDGTRNNASCAGATFYYTRNSYNLVFNNGEEDKRTESVKFEASLNGYATYELAATDAPSKYEPGSVEFAGWYLNPECSDDAKVDFTNAGDGEPWTMPASNLIVYAKWVLVDRNVTFYRSKADAAKHGTDNAVTPLTETFQVTHKELVPVANIPVTDPESDDCITPPEGMVGYEFDGWFYMDGGEEKPYTKEMPVTKDLVIYAKWKTTQVANFTVRYVLLDEDGNEIEVAEPLEGKTIVGQNMTFDAKTGVELKEAYRTNYFPTLYSSAITINADASQNVYTFYYTHKESVSYTVYYVEVSAYTENEDGTVSFTLADPAKPYIRASETLTTASSFVAADFVPVVGYVAADGVYHKTLNVVAEAPSVDENGNYIADKDVAETSALEHENIIVFYYFNDPTQSPYTIKHMLQNQDLSGYTEAEDDTIQKTGKNGTEYGDNLNNYTNYEYVRAEVVYYDADGDLTTAPLTRQEGDGRAWDISYRLPDNGLGMTIYIYYDLTVGDLSITKNVVNTAPDFEPMKDKFTFTVELKDANDNALSGTVKYQIGDSAETEVTLNAGKFSFTLEDEQTVVVKDLLHGTKYTVTEQAEVGFTTTSTNASSSIEAGQTKEVVFTNTYKVGTLNVTKTVVGLDAPKDQNGAFSDEFTFTLTVPGFAGLKIKIGETDKVLDENGATTFTLKGGQSTIITGIPHEANFTVTETEHSDYTTTVDGTAGNTASGKMDADATTTAAVTFTNTYKTGSLTIKKTATGGNAGDTFLFDVTGPNDYMTTVVLTAGEEITLTELPFGEYFVKENTAWSWRYTTDDADKSATISATQNGNVEISNAINNEKWLDDETTKLNVFDGKTN